MNAGRAHVHEERKPSAVEIYLANTSLFRALTAELVWSKARGFLLPSVLATQKVFLSSARYSSVPWMGGDLEKPTQGTMGSCLLSSRNDFSTQDF